MSSVFGRLRFRRDHRWAPGHMSAYVDEELGPATRRRMERHVRDCEECRGLLDGLLAMLDALHRLPAPIAVAGAPQLAAAVRLRLEEPPRCPPPSTS